LKSKRRKNSAAATDAKGWEDRGRRQKGGSVALPPGENFAEWQLKLNAENWEAGGEQKKAQREKGKRQKVTLSAGSQTRGL